MIIWINGMKNIAFKFTSISILTFSVCFWGNLGLAAENIIQQEKISFQRCLKIITVSEEKLSISPEIDDISEKKRVAIFTLTDGTLKIICDGYEELVTVSTEMN